VPDRVKPSFVIFDIWALCLTLSPERQSAQMSKITNDGLTRSGTECFIAVPIWQQCASKGIQAGSRCGSFADDNRHLESNLKLIGPQIDTMSYPANLTPPMQAIVYYTPHAAKHGVAVGLYKLYGVKTDFIRPGSTIRA